MIDVFAVHTTAKCSWIKRLLIGENKYNIEKNHIFLLDISAEMLNRNITYTKFTKCKSNFHEQILSSWNMLHNNICPTKTIDILNQNVLCNQSIKINNKHVTGKQLTTNHLGRTVLSLKFFDIIDNNGNFYNSTDINNKLNLRTNSWNWMAIISAIPKSLKHKMTIKNCLENQTNSIKSEGIYIINNNTAKDAKMLNSKQIYNKLIAEKTCPPTSINKWVEIYPFMEQCNGKPFFSFPTKSPWNPFYKHSSIKC